MFCFWLYYIDVCINLQLSGWWRSFSKAATAAAILAEEEEEEWRQDPASFLKCGCPAAALSTVLPSRRPCLTSCIKRCATLPPVPSFHASCAAVLSESAISPSAPSSFHKSGTVALHSSSLARRATLRSSTTWLQCVEQTLNKRVSWSQQHH